MDAHCQTLRTDTEPPVHPAARSRVATICAVIVAGLVLGACQVTPQVEGDDEAFTVGFVLVGARDDLGYNQAVWEGSLALARAQPDVEVLRVEHVPESDAAVATMQDLIDQGADMLFATSFGHFEPALEIARANPDVVVLHQGGRIADAATRPPNFGTYWGTHHEAMYLAGLAAGHATESGRLGFVAAFPIPSTHASVNAFTLGAQAARADVVTDVVFTSDWCAPARQLEAAAALLDRGADVLGQHQDCTATVLGVAEARGVRAVGLHQDGSEAAPTAWLTGAVWVWDHIYDDAVTTVRRGTFDGSRYQGDYRGTIASTDTPMILTEFGPGLDETARAQIDAEWARLLGGASPFDGPVRAADGSERVPAGSSLTVEQVDQLDWFVDGVTTLDLP